MASPVYSQEWLVSNFQRAESGSIYSPSFKLGPHTWELSLNLCQSKKPHTHLSVYLQPVGSKAPLAAVNFKFVLRNWQDPKDDFKNGDTSFTYPTGYPSFIPRDELSVASGFLRATDGALLLRVELEYKTPPPASGTTVAGSSSGGGGGAIYPATLRDGTVSAGSGDDIATDLLSLWKRPGPTSDLIIIATAPAVAAACSSTAAGAVAKGAGAAAATNPTTATAAVAGGGGSRTPSSSGGRFDVHRAILAARCPYFATLFESGMRDSSARELPLPDTDPAALKPLLQFMYSGGLTVTTRQQARSCFELADRLLLPKAAALLRTHLLSTVTATSVVQDLLWAADAAPTTLLTGLMDFAAEVEADLPERGLQVLAAERPVLMAQLFTAARRAAKRFCS